MKALFLALGCYLTIFGLGVAQVPPSKARFNALVLAEHGGHHLAFSQAGKVWLDQLARDSSFTFSFIRTTDSITAPYLSRYQLIIQLDYVPYGWAPEAAAAFRNYITQGKGGWVGFHHATLLGEFDGYPIWDWFSSFMGGIRYQNYIPGFASATVVVEDPKHPVVQNVPRSFVIQKDEWYTYTTRPRSNVHVLAHVDESSYQPDSEIKMGDHPVIWSNQKVKARNVYIFMGHSPDLFTNPAWTTLFRNAIFWAAAKK
jgi:hypothetical protein